MIKNRNNHLSQTQQRWCENQNIFGQNVRELRRATAAATCSTALVWVWRAVKNKLLTELFQNASVVGPVGLIIRAHNGP